MKTAVLIAALAMIPSGGDASEVMRWKTTQCVVSGAKVGAKSIDTFPGDAFSAVCRLEKRLRCEFTFVDPKSTTYTGGTHSWSEEYMGAKVDGPLYVFVSTSSTSKIFISDAGFTYVHTALNDGALLQKYCVGR